MTRGEATPDNSCKTHTRTRARTQWGKKDCKTHKTKKNSMNKQMQGRCRQVQEKYDARFHQPESFEKLMMRLTHETHHHSRRLRRSLPTLFPPVPHPPQKGHQIPHLKGDIAPGVRPLSPLPVLPLPAPPGGSILFCALLAAVSDQMAMCARAWGGGMTPSLTGRAQIPRFIPRVGGKKKGHW